MRCVERLQEHALVELEPAQLPIDVERGILEIARIDVDGRYRAEYGPGCEACGVSFRSRLSPFDYGGVTGGVHRFASAGAGHLNRAA
jgi:hypothetical protein